MSSISSPIFGKNPNSIDTDEKRSAFTLSMIGLDDNGLLHACLFADAGFRTICADLDQAYVNKLTTRKALFFNDEIGEKLARHIKTGRMIVTTDLKSACSQADIIALSLTFKIDSKKRTDQSQLHKIARQVGSCMRRGVMVILISPVGLGTVGGTLKETLEGSSGYKTSIDFALAYSPTSTLNRQSLEEIKNSERIVASPDKKGLTLASAIMKAVTQRTLRQTDDLKLAELAVLYVMAHEDVDLGLRNELALLCENTNLDFHKVDRLAFGEKTTEQVDPAVANEKLRAASYALVADSEDLNVHMEILTASRQINERMIKHEAQLIREALKSAGKPARRAKIALLGISQQKNTKAPISDSARQLVGLLEAKEAKVGVYDPYYTEKEELGEIQKNHRRSLTEALEGADSLAILTGHDEFADMSLKKVKAMMKKSPSAIDFEGILDPGTVEAEGFIYRGFGRGVWTK